MLKTIDFKLQFLGIIPQFSDETGTLNPEQISALSALLTFKGKSVKGLLKETLDKGQDLDKKVRIILNKSSLRGHASVATTPTLAFSFEASKFIDSMLTGIVFSSSLMASGRRTDTSEKDIVYPTAIGKNKKAKELYRKQSLENLGCQNWLLSKGVTKDEASKILQYGIYGTGIMVLPVESLVGFVKEWEMEKEWMPEEAEILIDLFKKELKKLGISQLFYTRQIAPRDTYPYPNIFKDPKHSNLPREIGNSRLNLELPGTGGRIWDCFVGPVPELRRKLKELNKLTKEISSSKTKILKEWPKLLALRRQICRDYNLAVNIKVLSNVSWRVWGEKKRHRTVPQVVDSIYYSIEQAIKKLKTKNKKQKTPFDSAQGRHIKNIKIIESCFSVPPTIKKNPHFLKRYVNCFLGSLDCYQKLIKMGIKPRDAVFVIPRGIRIKVLQEYNLFNLISGYYPLRLCSTAEEQLRSTTRQEADVIRKILKKKKFPELAEAISVKCQTTCFCHEENNCGQIKKLVKNYDEKFHKKMLGSLEEKYKMTNR